MNKNLKRITLDTVFAFAFSASISLVAFVTSSKEAQPEFAKPGMVAYAASYSSSATSEPKYNTQYSTTFQYLNLGDTFNQYRGDAVKVGIIDSGINYDHEDFMVNSSTKVKGDSKYYSYTGSSWVYYGASKHGYSYIDDTLGHGTNVAATVAAAINGVGGTGLAPNVELYVYKVTNSSNGYEFGAIQNALMDAETLGLDVINMSFQSYEHAVSYNSSSMAASSGCSTIMEYYLNQAHNAGITLVGAAGNFNTSEPSYPGSNAHVINVGSLNSTGTGKAGFSNYGSTIDLVAPGYVYVADEASNTAYTNTQGTSFSAPLVTAAIALYIQQNPSATPDQIEAALYASCDEIDDSGSQYTNWAGHGSLNVARFLGVQSDSPTQIVINNPEVENEELSLEVGDTFDLDWTVLGNGTFSSDVDIYAYEDNGTFSVDSNGRITALKEGTDYVVIESVQDPNIYASIYVTVNPSSVTLSSIAVKTAPSKTTYLEGDTFNPAGLVITATYSNSSTVDIAYAQHAADFTFSPSTSTALTPSNTSVTISYGGKNCSQAISVTAKTLSYITLASEKKTTYKVGDTFVKPTVTAHYDNSTSADVTNSATFTGYNLSNSGEQTVTVTYGGKSATYDITVYRVTSLSATLNVGTNGNTTWTDSQKTASATVDNVTFTAVGSGSNDGKYYSSDKTWRFYTNNSSGINITVPSGYEITSVVLTWKTGIPTTPEGTTRSGTTSPTTYTVNSSGVTSLSFRRTSSNFLLQTAVVNYNYLSLKTLSSISLSGQKTQFVEGDEFTFGGTVTAHYDNNTSADVTSSATFTGYDMSVPGEQTVTVSYSESGVNKSETYSITVATGTLSSISIEGMTTVYQRNNTFSFDGTCTAIFANGYQKVVTPTNVTSPDMSTAGNKTITVTYTYNNVTKTTSYEITVNAVRTVYELTETILGTVTYPDNTETVSISTLSVSYSGYTNKESNTVRLGSSSKTGTVTVTSTTANIYKVVVSAKRYNTDSGVILIVGGVENTLPNSSSYSTYSKEYTTPVNSVSIATKSSDKRANVQSITIYTKVNTNIGQSEDCVGLETFITNYMHMDYTSNLGYCSDSEHHYYSSAKTAFNGLNDHQRNLFVNNSAYTNEYARLCEWARINGDSINSNNKLEQFKGTVLKTGSDKATIIIISIVAASLLTVGGYLLLRKRKEND